MIAPVNGGRMGGLGDGWKIELRIVDGLYNACHIVTGKQDAAAKREGESYRHLYNECKVTYPPEPPRKCNVLQLDCQGMM